MNAGPYIAGGIIDAIGIGVFAFGFNRMHKYQLIQDTPRSNIRSMAKGLVELEGKATASKPIIAHFSQTPCVYYRYTIEEYQEKVSKDSKGNSTTTREWVSVASDEQRTPFTLADSTGTVPIEPGGSECNVSLKKQFIQRARIGLSITQIINTIKNNSSTATATTQLGLIPLESTTLFENPQIGDRKYSEYYIEQHAPVFVIGTATITPAGTQVKKSENESTFIISDKSEKELLKSLKWQMLSFFAIGGLLVIGGVLIMVLLGN